MGTSSFPLYSHAIIFPPALTLILAMWLALVHETIVNVAQAETGNVLAHWRFPLLLFLEIC